MVQSWNLTGFLGTCGVTDASTGQWQGGCGGSAQTSLLYAAWYLQRKSLHLGALDATEALALCETPWPENPALLKHNHY